MTLRAYVDPGVRCTGVAAFASGALVFVAARRSAAIGGALREAAILEHNYEAFSCAAIVTIEIPQIYPAGKQGGDPNDLIAVAVVAGAYAGLAQANGAEVQLIRPAFWKGQTPKAVMHGRMFKALTPAECVVLEGLKCPSSFRHNVYDAVCMGLVDTGRIR